MNLRHLVLPKDCQPIQFHYTLRPYIAGPSQQGWAFELSPSTYEHFIFSGSTAGVSALIQAPDAFLSIDPEGKHKAFRREMQEYIPRDHREFVTLFEGVECA